MEMNHHQQQHQPQPPPQHLPQPSRPQYKHQSPYQPPPQHQPRAPHKHQPPHPHQPQPPRSPHKHQPQPQPQHLPPHQHQPQPPYHHQHHPQPSHHPQHLQYQPSHMLYQQPHMPYQNPYQSYQPCQLQKGTNWVSSPSAIRRNCDFCVQKKVKCPGSEDGKGCATCRRKGIKCMYSPKRKPGPKARKRDGEEGAAISASNPGAAEGERYHSPSATDASTPATAVAPATATPAAPIPASKVTFSAATASVSATAPTASSLNSSAPTAAASTASAPTAADVMQKKEAKKFKKWMKKMKIKEEISDIVASSCRGARGGVSDGGMTSTSTTSFSPEAPNYTSESTVLSAAASDPLVAGFVGVGCIGGVKRKGKKMKGKKSKGKSKGVQGSSAPSDVQQDILTLKKLSSKKRKSPQSLSWVTGSSAAKASRVSSPRSSNFPLAGWRGGLDTNVSDIVGMEIGGDGEGPTAESAIGDGPSTVLNAYEEATIVSAPMTIAEQLDAVKVEEAEMLRKFEKTHKRFIKEEARKRAEIEEFRRAGEEALRVMQVVKEGKLRRISDKGKRLRARRLELVQQRLKEIEDAEKAARAEALERDARLEAERKRLAHCCEDSEEAAPVGEEVNAIDGYARLGFFAEETDKGRTAAAASAANGANGVASEYRSSSAFGEGESYNDGKQQVEETGGN